MAEETNSAVLETPVVDPNGETEGSIEVPENAPLPGEPEVAPAIRPVLRTQDGRFASIDQKHQAQDKIDQEAFDKITGKTPEPEPETKQEPEPEQKPKEEAKSEVETTTPDQRLQQAIERRALKRAQWTDDEIEKLSPDALKAKAEKLIPFFAEVDRRTVQATMPKADDAATKAAVVEDQATATKATDLDRTLQDLLDEDTAKAVKQRIVDAETRAARAEDSAMLSRVRALVAPLKSEFPKIDTPEEWSKVVNTMARLDPEGVTAMGSDEQLGELIRQSAWAVFGPQIKQQSQQKALETNRQQRANQPSRSSDNRQPVRKQSQDEVDQALFERFSKGTPLEGMAGSSNGSRASLMY